MNQLKLKPNSKGHHHHMKNDVFSPIMQYMKDVKPIIKKKQSAKRGPGTKTQHYSRGGQSSIGYHHESSNSYMAKHDMNNVRAHTSLSPDMISQRPRKILMPNLFTPEFLFAYRNSKVIINKIRENLNSLCLRDKKINLRSIDWLNKFTAEIKDICRLELVQIGGEQFTHNTSQQNLYTVLFSTIGNFDNSLESFELYNKVCHHSVLGIE